MLERNKKYSFSEIINYIKEVYMKGGEQGLYKDNGWCVYSEQDEIDLYSDCYVDGYPSIDDNDEEIFPQSVVDKNLDLLYRDEMIQDVIFISMKRDKNTTNEDILKYIKYYDDNDCFPQELI